MDVDSWSKDVGNTKLYYINFMPKDGQTISFDVAERINYEQALLFIKVSSMFDTVPLKEKESQGKLLLCREENAVQMITIAVKACYRCYIGNNYKYSKDIDSIIIKKEKHWRTKITSCKLSQNQRPDKVLMLPVDYTGFFAVSDGCVFILPNQT